MLTSLLLLALTATPNLVTNPGFEDGAAGWSLPTGFAADPATAHTGKGSLRYVNTDPALYRLASAPVPCKPGRQYELSVWVKTEDVAGDDTGATICLEWTGANGWLGGAYPAGIKGTRDWTLIRGRSAPIPAEATSVNVSLYLRKGMTGRAWFDDVTVREVFPTPLTARLRRPAYRGRLAAGDAKATAALDVQVAERLEGDPAPGDLRVTVALAQGERELWVRDLKLDGHAAHPELPLGALAPGRYDLVVRLTARPDGRELATQRFAIEALDPQAPAPKVWLDDQGRTIVDGKPFFPLGLYDGSSPAADLRRMAAAGFNCVMPYGINGDTLDRPRGYLDAAQAAGLKVIYSVKDFYDGAQYRPKRINGWTDVSAMTRGVVAAFKDHPALLAWYANDEMPTEQHAVLRQRYDEIRDTDPGHPVWVVVYQVDELPQYADTTDVLGTDPYPLPDKPLAMAGQWTAKTVAAMAGAGSVWQVPQIFDWAVYRKGPEKDKHHPPTLAEMRNMTFACLAAGAHGLIYYSDFDLKRDALGFDRRWADVTALAQEVRALEPFLLSDQPSVVCALTGGEPNTGFARLWRLGHRVLAMAANGGKQPLHVTWQLPAEPAQRFGAAQAVTTTGADLAPGEAIAVIAGN